MKKSGLSYFLKLINIQTLVNALRGYNKFVFFQMIFLHFYDHTITYSKGLSRIHELFHSIRK